MSEPTTTTTTNPDWRKLPRKPRDQIRNSVVTINITAGNREALRRNAAAANLTLVDYVIARCCK